MWTSAAAMNFDHNNKFIGWGMSRNWQWELFSLDKRRDNLQLYRLKHIVMAKLVADVGVLGMPNLNLAFISMVLGTMTTF